MSRNSITPSRAFLTIGVLVKISGASPLGPARRSRTPMAQLACGFGGPPFTSIRHIRQLPAIDRRSWKQKRGISAPAASAAWRSVNSAGTSISLPSTLILAMALPTPLGAPELYMLQMRPVEGKIRIAVRFEMIQPRLGLGQGRDVSGFDEPHHEMMGLQLLEPLGFAVVEALVERLPDESLEIGDRLPHAHVHRHRRIGKRTDV